MNRNRLILIGIVALAIAAVLTVTTFRSLRRISPTERPMTAVVVATVELGVGARISEKDIRTIQFPIADQPEGAFHSTSELVGRGVVLPISKNDFVLAGKLAPEKAGSGLPTLIPSGMRAVSVKVNEVISVAGFVVPGTRVDVLLTGNPRALTSSDEMMTTTVLENIEVLAAGQKLERDEQGRPQSVTVITLLVSPDDAQKLTLAATEGKVQLVLRNPLDIGERKPVAIRSVSLYRAPAPVSDTRTHKRRELAKKAVDPPSVFVVERILGDKRDTVKF